MFEQNQIKAWRSVTAPADLRERVMAAAGAETASKKTAIPLRKYLAAAACAAIVLFGAFAGYTQSAFTVDSAPPSQAMSVAARQVSPSDAVEFELDARRSTTVTVSSGTAQVLDENGVLLASGSSVSAKGKVTLRWSIGSEENEQTLRLESGLKSKKVTLAYDPLSASWTTDLK